MLPTPAASAPPSPPPAQLGFHLSSVAIDDGGELRSVYACDGVSPPLHWQSAPAGTNSYALTFTESDGDGRRTLWAIYGIPADLGQLGQGARNLIRIEAPRCRPGARYEYTLYALAGAPGSVQSVTRTATIGGVVVNSYQPSEGVLSIATLSAYFTGR